MADEETKTVPHEQNRVDIENPDEVSYWTKQLGCTVEELRAAVEKVGVLVENVAPELKLHFA
jgi:hypothetical protein